MPPNAAEEIVASVLGWLKRRDRILGYLRNNPSDRLDVEGIDFLVFLRNGLALPLQIKTSSGQRNNEEKIRTHFAKHPYVKYVIVVDIHAEERQAIYRQIARNIRLMVRDSVHSPWW